MEDLDPDRSRPEHADLVLRDLEWLGLDWDGDILWQSTRREAHREALAELAREGLVYPCVCTRKELEEAAAAPHPGADAGHAGGDGTLRYPGTCLGLYPDLEAAREATGRQAAWRFRVPGGELDVQDQLHGAVRGDVQAEVGDFPVTRRDGVLAYQLAVVLDDAYQGVTEVVRGDDLLPSTLRQARLQEALGLPHPEWYHVSLVTDPGGRRLAKRSDDLGLATLREAGVPATRIVAWAARSAGLEPSIEPGVEPLIERGQDSGPTAAELAKRFRWEDVPRREVPTGADDWLAP